MLRVCGLFAVCLYVRCLMCVVGWWSIAACCLLCAVYVFVCLCVVCGLVSVVGCRVSLVVCSVLRVVCSLCVVCCLLNV